MPSMPRPGAKGPAVDFSSPAGAPAYFSPDSVHWQIYRNPIALGVGGICAVLLEFADPRIRSGVWDHSTYRVDPIGRSQRTGIAALVGVYGPRETAERMIAAITRMHAKVAGETPDGRAYRALDPELLNWVAATAGFGFVTAYDRFVRALSDREKSEFWQNGGDLAALYGVTESPQSEAHFLEMMERLAPGFEPHPINSEFLEIVRTTDAAGRTPGFVRRAVVRAAVSLLPPLVRERLELGAEYDLGWFDRFTIRTLALLADRRFDRESPPAVASTRLGLPANFLWRRPEERRRLLEAREATGTGVPRTSPAVDA